MDCVGCSMVLLYVTLDLLYNDTRLPRKDHIKHNMHIPANNFLDNLFLFVLIFLLSSQQSFSYVGTGLPGLN